MQIWAHSLHKFHQFFHNKVYFNTEFSLYSLFWWFGWLRVWVPVGVIIVRILKRFNFSFTLIHCSCLVQSNRWMKNACRSRRLLVSQETTSWCCRVPKTSTHSSPAKSSEQIRSCAGDKGQVRFKYTKTARRRGGRNVVFIHLNVTYMVGF